MPDDASPSKPLHGGDTAAVVIDLREYPRLSTLEAQVLAEVASGATNDEAADRLGYSANYVKDVLASARERLGARDRAHAAALAVALELVCPSGDGRFAPAPTLSVQSPRSPHARVPGGAGTRGLPLRAER